MSDFNPLNTDDNIEEGESLVQPLAQDNATPFSAPTDPVEDTSEELDVRTQEGQLGSTHPATDSATNLDSHEYYDEGLSGVAEAEEPNEGDTVAKYDPEKDQRNQQ